MFLSQSEVKNISKSQQTNVTQLKIFSLLYFIWLTPYFDPSIHLITFNSMRVEGSNPDLTGSSSSLHCLKWQKNTKHYEVHLNLCLRFEILLFHLFCMPQITFWKVYRWLEVGSRKVHIPYYCNQLFLVSVLKFFFQISFYLYLQSNTNNFL